MSSFLDMIAARIAYPFLYLLLSLLSGYRRLLSIGSRTIIHIEESYSGQKIVLLALYQKGVLRPDTLRFLQGLKEQDHYVIVINALRLTNPDSLRGLCGCYLERFNFGRDFGSYKEGFHHIFARGWDKDCPRLLLMNDSVYCSFERSKAFVKDMMDSESEVLGSTENYEIIHHLGSFCISLGGSVIRSKIFRRFWANYRNSDVRPKVIREGEQNFSKMLRRAVSAPEEFQTLFGTHSFLVRLQESDVFLDDAIRNARVSPLTGWKRFTVREVIEELRKKYLVETIDTTQLEANVELTGPEVSERVYVGSFKEILSVARANLKDGNSLDEDVVKDVVISQLTEVYMSGSQIHQNASTLLKMGLPIVKLDGLYRGMFTIQDMQMIGQHLQRHEAKELQELLLERPYGGDALRDWRRAAFMRGLI